MKKKFICILVSIVAALIILGLIFLICFIFDLIFKPTNEYDYLISYINSKYTDDSFYFDSEYALTDEADYGIIACSEKYPDSKIYIYDCNGVIKDNYLDVKYYYNSHHYFDNALKTIIETNFRGYGYTLTTSVKNDNLSSDVDFLTYLTDKDTLIGFKVTFSTNSDINKDHIEKSLGNALTKLDINICGQFVFDVNYIETNILSYGISDGEVVLCKWRY